MSADIRKIATWVEETHREIGQQISPPTRKAVAVAVIKNPFAGSYTEDLTPLMDIGAELGGLLGDKCVAALGITPAQAESYGKAAMVGEGGELEHGACWHVPGGYAMRELLGSAKAIVPSATKVGAAGTRLDVALGHKDAAYVRSHFDAMEVGIHDAPRAEEIVYCLVMTTGGRIHARVGGLQVSEIKGEDGLR